MNVDNFAPVKKANDTLFELEGKLERGCEGQLQSAKRRAKSKANPNLYNDAKRHVDQTKKLFEQANSFQSKIHIAKDCSARAYWLIGLATKVGVSKGGNQRAINIKVANREKHLDWQKLADEIWTRNPGSKVLPVARLIEKRHPDNPPANTVRKIIKKPTT